MPAPMGHRIWAIAEGYIPPGSTGSTRELVSHETVCILNAGSPPAHVEIMVYFADRPPAGPYRFDVEGMRTRHLRFNDFADPERIPVGTDFSSVIKSDVPVVVQHTRLDTERSQRSRDCVGYHAANWDDAALAGAFGAQRIAGRRGILQLDRSNLGKAVRTRQRVVGQRSAQELAITIVVHWL